MIKLSRFERNQNQSKPKDILRSVYNDVENHLLQAASHVIESLTNHFVITNLVSCDHNHVKTKLRKQMYNNFEEFFLF
jgi:uncharacterized phosphosugar-binding protein